MTDEHTSPIKTPKQLIIVVLVAFAVPIALAVLISQLVTSGVKGVHEDDSQVLSRIQAVGNVVLAEASVPKGTLTGEQVYGQVCKTCHEAGLAGAPKFGDKAAWAARIAQGESVMTQHAIAGFQGKAGAMPAKGGNTELTDGEVHRAVVFMANKAGATWKEPAAPVAVVASSERTGEQVVNETCGKCHSTGEGGAPKIGDRDAWIKRAKDGYARVLQSALKGHAGMPARGGLAELSDAEIKRAIDYMMKSGSATPVPGGTAAAVPVVATASAAAATTSAATPATAPAVDGKKVFAMSCAACHAAGVAGAPKFGDKAAWAPRIAQGVSVLYTHALGGFQGKAGVMPPKGGNTTLPDADVKAAVDYMVAAAK
jgi:cytochrome c5